MEEAKVVTVVSLGSLYLFYCPTEGRRLSQARHNTLWVHSQCKRHHMAAAVIAKVANQSEIWC